jgi:hypothetical protein
MESKAKLKGWVGGIAFVILVALGLFFQKHIFATPNSREILKRTEGQIINHIKAQILADQEKLLKEAEKRGNLKKASEKAALELKKLKSIKIESVECKRLDPIRKKERRNIFRFFGSQKYLIKAAYTIGDSKNVRYITLELKAPSSGNWQTYVTSRIY